MSGWMGKTTTDLNMREGTGLDYRIIAVLAEGTVFDILDEVGSNWLHIDVAGQEGYVYRGYVKMPRAAMTMVEVGVRESPGETSPIVTALYEDTQRALRQIEAAFEVGEEQSVMRTFFSVFLGAAIF